ncbi:transposase TnpA%2C Tn21 [Escherichia coli]|nr:transposase TnpA%2C Tn21 [Escherichia coli]CTW46364.1 transposase TnpA%2C Tn21 [Escherichia coli]
MYKQATELMLNFKDRILIKGEEDTGKSTLLTEIRRHCCKVSDEAAFCLIQRPYISKTLLTRRISPRGSP